MWRCLPSLWRQFGLEHFSWHLFSPIETLIRVEKNGFMKLLPKLSWVRLLPSCHPASLTEDTVHWVWQEMHDPCFQSWSFQIYWCTPQCSSCFYIFFAPSSPHSPFAQELSKVSQGSLTFYWLHIVLWDSKDLHSQQWGVVGHCYVTNNVPKDPCRTFTRTVYEYMFLLFGFTQLTRLLEMSAFLMFFKSLQNWSKNNVSVRQYNPQALLSALVIGTISLGEGSSRENSSHEVCGLSKNSAFCWISNCAP